MSIAVVSVAPLTRLVLVDEKPTYVVTIGENFDAALEAAEQWMGEPLETRSADPTFTRGAGHAWAPCRADRTYYSGFNPFDHFSLDRDPWIVGVETTEDE